MSSNASSVRPRDLREARDCLAEARRSGSRVLFRGAGTAQSWGALPEPVDLVVDTTGLDALIAYNPADMTVAVGAGMRLADLQARLDGQRVALDAARIARGATVGGLLATADAGPIRATYGSLRDLVIGVTVVLADATVARSGGHVIKNVAGYDLAKLFSGSLGAFGLITEVVLRVHPRPAHTATLAVPCDVVTAFALSRALLASPLEPVAVDWHTAGGPDHSASRNDAALPHGSARPPDGRLLIRFEGTESAVGRRLDKAVDLVRDEDATAVDRLTGAAEEAAWRAVSDTALGASGDTVFRAGARPDRLPDLVRLLDRASASAGVAYEVTSSTGIGVTTVRLRGPESADEDTAAAHAEVLRTWRAEVERSGGGVTLHQAADGVREKVPAWGRPPDAVGLLRALKHTLDPENRLAPGRFAPWMGGAA